MSEDSVCEFCDGCGEVTVVMPGGGHEVQSCSNCMEDDFVGGTHELKQLKAFIAAFEGELNKGRDVLSETEQYFIGWQQEIAIDTYNECLIGKFEQLKAQHLGESEKETTE